MSNSYIMIFHRLIFSVACCFAFKIARITPLIVPSDVAGGYGALQVLANRMTVAPSEGDDKAHTRICTHKCPHPAGVRTLSAPC